MDNAYWRDGCALSIVHYPSRQYPLSIDDQRYIHYPFCIIHCALSIIHRLPCPFANVHRSQGLAVVRYYPAEVDALANAAAAAEKEATKKDNDQRMTIEERWRAKIHFLLGVPSTRKEVTGNKGTVNYSKLRKKMLKDGCGACGYSENKFIDFVKQCTDEYVAFEHYRGYSAWDEWQAPSTLFIIRDALFIIQYSLSVLHRRHDLHAPLVMMHGRNHRRTSWGMRRWHAGRVASAAAKTMTGKTAGNSSRRTRRGSGPSFMRRKS